MNPRIYQACFASVYTILLLAIYDFYVSEAWAYIGFLKIASATSLLLSITLSILFASCIPLRFDTRSVLILVMHYVFFIPSFIVLASKNQNISHFISIVVSFGIIFFLSSLRFYTLPIRRLSKKNFTILTTSVLLLTVLLIAANGGFDNFNLNINRVYEYRRQVTAGLPSMLVYMFFGVAKVIAPMSLVLAIYFRSLAVFIFSFSCIVLLFGFTSQKSILFMPIFVAAFYLVAQHATSLKVILHLFLGVMVLACLEIIYLWVRDTGQMHLFNSLIIRRALFVPPLVDSFYFDFFSGAQKTYWSNSRLGLGIVSNPYDLDTPFLIGRKFFADKNISANTGFIGSGFSHAGYFGVFLYATFIGLLLASLQAYGRLAGHPFVSAVALTIFMTLITTSDFTTAILTHGLLMLIFLLIIFPNKQKSLN